MARPRFWWLGLVLAYWSTVASLASAQSSAQRSGAAAAEGQPTAEQKKKASEHFERGVMLFSDGAYRAALIEFERAYQTVPDYRLLYNLAHVRMLLEDYIGATRDYERYLAEGAENVPPERREVVEKELKILRERVARIVIRTSREDAKVYVDDVLIEGDALKAAIPLNIGRHRLYAETPDGATATRVVDLAAGELLEVDLELKAPVVRPVEVVTEEPTPLALPLSFTIATGALAIATLGVGLAQRSAQDELEQQVGTVGATRKSIDAARSNARALSITTDVLGGVTIALAVTSAVLWVKRSQDLKKDKRSARGWHLDVGLTSVAATHRF